METGIDAIIQDPDNDALRLSYADSLSVTGDADRAEFIRLQCERHEAGWMRGERECELLVLHPEWQEPFEQRLQDSEIGPLIGPLNFSRGFVDTVILSVDEYLPHAQELVKQHPLVRYLIVTGVREQLLAVLANPSLAHFKALLLSHHESTPDPEECLCDADMAAIASCEHLRNLTKLEIYSAFFGCNITDKGAVTFANAAALPNLQELQFVSGDLIGERGVRALATSRGLPSIKRLHLHNTFPEIIVKMQQAFPRITMTRGKGMNEM